MSDGYINLPVSGGGGGITALTGDVAASGSGSVAATVNSAAGGSVTFDSAKITLDNVSFTGYALKTHSGVLSLYNNGGAGEAFDLDNSNLYSRIPHQFLDRIDVQTSGNAGLPAIRFNGNTAGFNTGLYMPDMDQIGVSIAGSMTAAFAANVLSLFSDAITLDHVGTVAGNRLTLNVAGDASNPIILFNGNTSSNQTGFFQPGQDVIGITIDGTQIAAFSINGLELDSAVSAPASGVGTLTNMPAGVSGNPAAYLQLTVSGVTYVFPGWAM